jgi:hypothetical protein
MSATHAGTKKWLQRHLHSDSSLSTTTTTTTTTTSTLSSSPEVCSNF